MSSRRRSVKNTALPEPHGYRPVRRRAAALSAKQERIRDRSTEQWYDKGGSVADSGPSSVPGYYRKDYGQRKIDRRLENRDGDGNTFFPYAGFKRNLRQSDIDDMEDKRQEDIQVEYDRWISRKLDLTKPMVSKWLQTVEPKYYTRRAAYQKDKTRMIEFMSRMRLYGVHTLKDLQTLFFMDQEYNGGWQTAENNIAPAVYDPPYGPNFTMTGSRRNSQFTFPHYTPGYLAGLPPSDIPSLLPAAVDTWAANKAIRASSNRRSRAGPLGLESTDLVSDSGEPLLGDRIDNILGDMGMLGT